MSLCDTCKNKPDCRFTELGELAKTCNYYIAVNVGTVGHIDHGEPSIPVKDLEKLVDELEATADNSERNFYNCSTEIRAVADRISELINKPTS